MPVWLVLDWIVISVISTWGRGVILSMAIGGLDPVISAFMRAYRFINLQSIKDLCRCRRKMKVMRRSAFQEETSAEAERTHLKSAASCHRRCAGIADLALAMREGSTWMDRYLGDLSFLMRRVASFRRRGYLISRWLE